MSWHDSLSTLDGLRALTTVGDAVAAIEGNTVLATLRGLESLRTIGGTLTVEHNPALPTCEAEWLTDRVANLGGGSNEISDNGDAEECP